MICWMSQILLQLIREGAVIILGCISPTFLTLIGKQETSHLQAHTHRAELISGPKHTSLSSSSDF